jgi:hypothetical protein
MSTEILNVQYLSIFHSPFLNICLIYCPFLWILWNDCSRLGVVSMLQNDCDRFHEYIPECERLLSFLDRPRMPSSWCRTRSTVLSHSSPVASICNGYHARTMHTMIRDTTLWESSACARPSTRLSSWKVFSCTSQHMSKKEHLQTGVSVILSTLLRTLW